MPQRRHLRRRGRLAARGAAWQREGPRYRPGDRLEPELRLIRHPLRDGAPGEHWLDQRLTDDPGFLEGRLWGDGSVRVIGREYSGLRESPCFGGGEFSCLSCHQLHGAPADDQLAPGMAGDAACTRCHPAYASAAAAAAHSHHPASSAGSRCYNCHMPHATYGLLKASRNHEVDTPVASETLVGVRPNACNLCHLDRPLEWVGEHLERWYGIAAPEVEADARGIAAGLAWALQGDASQRALIAWHFGWEPAQAASGATWAPPILAILLDDPYDAVRLIAGRALGSIAGYDDLAAAYDYVGPAAERAAIARAVTERWQTRGDPHGDPRRDPALLRDADGALRADAVAARLAARDDRPIDLRE